MTGETAAMRRTHLTLIGTGGTISSRQTKRGVLAQVGAAELLDSLGSPQLSAGVVIEPVDAGTRPSFALTLTDMHGLARAAVEAARGGADGVVVLHGTDSMEETSFLTDLVHDGDAPIVFTGAQRPFDHPSGDGPANIRHALSTATDPRARGRGVLLAFDQSLWPARGVRKVHTTQLAAFARPGHSPLDLDTAPRVEARSTLAAARELAAELPRVDVVAAVPGGDGTGVRAAVATGARAIVLQGLGIGNAGLGDTQAVGEAIADGIPVLVTTRVAAGAVEPVYGGGGGADLALAGAVFAGTLSPWQARVLMAVAAAAEPSDPVTLVRGFLGRIRRPAPPLL